MIVNEDIYPTLNVSRRLYLMTRLAALIGAVEAMTECGVYGGFKLPPGLTEFRNCALNHEVLSFGRCTEVILIMDEWIRIWMQQGHGAEKRPQLEKLKEKICSFWEQNQLDRDTDTDTFLFRVSKGLGRFKEHVSDAEYRLEDFHQAKTISNLCGYVSPKDAIAAVKDIVAFYQKVQSLAAEFETEARDMLKEAEGWKEPEAATSGEEND